MCEQFWQLTAYEDPFDPEHALAYMRHAYDNGLLGVCIAKSEPCGFVAGVALPLLGNLHVTQVTELAFWINPDSRGQGIYLLEWLETAARKIGAKYINMISMQACEPKKAERIYRHMGYRKIETTFMKEL